MSNKDVSPSKRRLRLIGIWAVAFLLFQLLLVVLLSALMYLRVESEFKQITTFPPSSRKDYNASYGIGRVGITATYLIDWSDKEVLSRYEQQTLQMGWYSTFGQEGIFHCCGVSWWYDKEGLIAIIEFRPQGHTIEYDSAAEFKVAILWTLSPWDNATRIAASLDVVIVFALLAMWRARVKRI